MVSRGIIYFLDVERLRRKILKNEFGREFGVKEDGKVALAGAEAAYGGGTRKRKGEAYAYFFQEEVQVEPRLRAEREGSVSKSSFRREKEAYHLREGFERRQL